MLISNLLTEELFSGLAIGYHRTRNLKNTEAIGQSGLKAGDEGHYGPAIYLTYSFDDQQNDRMKLLYGPFIIRCKVNLVGFLIFDPDVAQRVYGDPDIRKQLEYLGITDKGLLASWSQSQSSFTSDVALSFAKWLYRDSKVQRKLRQPLKGLVFTGRSDGRVIVAYDRTTVIPFAWARVIDLDKTKDTVRWNKISQPPHPVDDTGIPEFERAARFFKRQGFTITGKGSAGVQLIGTVAGDYITIDITTNTISAYVTRHDPGKIPGYARIRGYRLIYNSYNKPSTLQSINDTMFDEIRQFKHRVERHVAVGELPAG